MDVKKLKVGKLRVNAYVLHKDGKCLLIDPGSDFETIRQAIGNAKVLAVLCTHNHFDHIGELHRFDAPLYMHSLDTKSLELITQRAREEFSVNITLPSQKFHDAQGTLTIGPFTCEVLHTPGHSPGSVCYYFKNHSILFTGDTLFVGTHGRTDLPGSDDAQMKKSLHKLFQLPSKTHIYPGHGWDGKLYSEKTKMDEILQHIKKIEQPIHIPSDNGTLIGMPEPFIAPNNELFARNQFYWDSYFTVQGLLQQGELDLAKGMVDNLSYLLVRFGLIPMRNEMYNVGISQPPFFSSMIRNIYSQTQDKEWLKKLIPLIEQELHQYWMNDDHIALGQLSRYCDHFITNATAEHESGWDMTSRFGERALHVIPVDLNCLLYKYERDLVFFHTIIGNSQKAQDYEQSSRIRKDAINTYLWDSKTGFYYDYDTELGAQRNFKSLAAYYALWSGVASENQAKQLHNHIKIFLCPGGLANTQASNLLQPYRQWDYPNGWPNQQLIVVDGLRKYGYGELANDIMLAWQTMVVKVFDSTKVLWEKYDVVARAPGKSGRYPTQTGFGWTNAVYCIFKEYLNQQGL